MRDNKRAARPQAGAHARCAARAVHHRIEDRAALGLASEGAGPNLLASSLDDIVIDREYSRGPGAITAPSLVTALLTKKLEALQPGALRPWKRLQGDRLAVSQAPLLDFIDTLLKSTARRRVGRARRAAACSAAFKRARVGCRARGPVHSRGRHHLDREEGGLAQGRVGHRPARTAAYISQSFTWAAEEVRFQVTMRKAVLLSRG